MRRAAAPPAVARRRRAVARAACLLLAALSAVAAVAALLAFGPMPQLPAGVACPGGVVLVSNARYLTRGNVGHWGYALFGLHAALAAAPPPGAPGAAPQELTLFFDARVKTGDWVRSMLAALELRHGVAITLEEHRAGRCAGRARRAGDADERQAAPHAGAWAWLDANEARTLLSGRETALRQAWRDVCGIPPPDSTRPSADVLVYNRHAGSTRRLCALDGVYALLRARGLTWEYVDVPSGACAQVAALSAPRRFVLTPHGAHEVNLFATWPNATVVEVMPRYTDIPIYNALVNGTVWMISQALEGAAFPCRGGACAPLPRAYGTCTRSTLCRKWARNRPCVRANLAALAAVLDGGAALRRAEAAALRLGQT